MKKFCFLFLIVSVLSCENDEIKMPDTEVAFRGVETIDNSEGLQLVTNTVENANTVSPYYFFKTISPKRYSAIWEGRTKNQTGIYLSTGSALEFRAIEIDSLYGRDGFGVLLAENFSYDDLQEYSKVAKREEYFSADISKIFTPSSGSSIVEENVVQYDTIELRKELVNFFDPERFSCDLPKKIKRKLKSRGNFIPKSLLDNFEGLPATAYKFSDASIAVLLNTFEVEPSDGSEKYPVTVTSSQTYSSFDVQKYIDAQRSNFAYALDCSGYLSAAFSLEAKAPIGDIQSSAQASLDRSNSVFLARAFIFSPILSAIRPRQYNKGNFMTTSERLDALVSIISTIGATNDEDILKMPPLMDVLWTSKEGKSKFNGEGKLSGNAGAGIGIASLSFKTSAGASLTRSTSFSNYDSYLLNSEIIQNNSPIKVKEIKEEIKKLTKRALITDAPSTVDGKKVFTLGFPSTYCDLNWEIEEPNFTFLQSRSVEKGCEYEVLSTGNSTSIITLKTNLEGMTLKKKVFIQ